MKFINFFDGAMFCSVVGKVKGDQLMVEVKVSADKNRNITINTYPTATEIPLKLLMLQQVMKKRSLYIGLRMLKTSTDFLLMTTSGVCRILQRISISTSLFSKIPTSRSIRMFTISMVQKYI